MTLLIGVLTVKGKQYHPTRRMAEAAAERDAEIIPINPYHVQPAYRDNRPVLHGDPVASKVRIVLPRQGAEVKTACLPLMAHYEQMGIRIVNGYRTILMARNKFFLLQAMTRCGVAVPDTIFATSMDGCRRARGHFAPDPVVLKPINGRQGTGLHCLAPEQSIPEDVAAQLDSGRGVLVQAFIHPMQRRDFRVLVIGPSVIGAIELTPPVGDFRANVHVGSRPAKAKLSPAMARLAMQAVGATGMEIAGVDLIVPRSGDPLVIEVNSAPGFRAFEAVTGKDVAGAMIDYVKSLGED